MPWPTASSKSTPTMTDASVLPNSAPGGFVAETRTGTNIAVSDMRRLAAVGMTLLLVSQFDFVRADESGLRDPVIRADPCEDKPSAPAWLDRMQATLYRTTCRA